MQLHHSIHMYVCNDLWEQVINTSHIYDNPCADLILQTLFTAHKKLAKSHDTQYIILLAIFNTNPSHPVTFIFILPLFLRSISEDKWCSLLTCRMLFPPFNQQNQQCQSTEGNLKHWPPTQKNDSTASSFLDELLDSWRILHYPCNGFPMPIPRKRSRY